MQVDTGQFQDLVAQVAELAAQAEQTRAQLRDEGRAEVILRRAFGKPPAFVPRHAAPKRDRHGLHLVGGDQR